MRLRYFVVDVDGRLWKAPRSAVLALWDGKGTAAGLGCPGVADLRLLSALCDDDLLPRRLYLLRLPLSHGRFTPEDYLTLRAFTRRDCVTAKEVVRHHATGWPDDLRRQLAVALDVPATQLDVPIRVGGPLFVAAARGVTPHQALRFLR
jgi:hypothetical protein